MDTPENRRVIVSIEPQLVGSALAAWLTEKPDLDVVVDHSGVAALVAGPSDVVLSSRPVPSLATVFVVDESGTHFSVKHCGGVEPHRYVGLDRLGSLIEEQRAPPTSIPLPGNGRCG